MNSTAKMGKQVWRKGLRVLLLASTLHASALWAESPAAITAYLENQVRTTQMPGVVAMVVDAKGIRYEGAWGLQNRGAQQAMQSSSIFRIASMTKPITSLAVMLLVERGKLKLDDPVETFLPEYARPQVIESFYPLDRSYTTRPAIRSITIRHLLANTSGLGYSFSTLALFQLQGTSSPSQALPQPVPLMHDPGTEWTYGDSTRVLGRVVEKISGQSLDVFLSQEIFEPLGMVDTSFVVPAEKHGRVATIHRWSEGALVEQAQPAVINSPVFGDGGLHSTAQDYARFIQLFLNKGKTASGRQLVKSATLAQMGRNQLGNQRVRLQDASNPSLAAVFPLGAGRDGFGLGFQITGEPAPKGLRRPGSLSWAGIFNTEFWIDPAAGLGGILLMQYLPFYDRAAIETLLGFEQRVYSAFAP